MNNRHLRPNLRNLHHPLLNRHRHEVAVQVERVAAVAVQKVVVEEELAKEGVLEVEVEVVEKIRIHFGRREGRVV